MDKETNQTDKSGRKQMENNQLPRSILKKNDKKPSRIQTQKTAKFDEMNIMQTLHPNNKDYGYMQINEPKTPYNYDPDRELHVVSPEVLAEKLRVAASMEFPSFSDHESSDEEIEESPIEKAHRLEFERRRKRHYNEFDAVKLARELIEQEFTDDMDIISKEHLDLSESNSYESEIIYESHDKDYAYKDDDINEQQKIPIEQEKEREQEQEQEEDASFHSLSNHSINNNNIVDETLPKDHPCYRRPA